MSEAEATRWRRRARWFAAEFAAEFAVVVTGVLVALAINASWASWQDERTEAVYLEQLRSDLDETATRLARADAEMAGADRAGGQLVRAFRTAPPPRDSVTAWLRAAVRYRYPSPVTATAETLVATGDLVVLDDARARAAVVAYLAQSRLLESDFQQDVARWQRARDDLLARVDYGEVLAEQRAPAASDSLARAFSDYPLPVGPSRRPFPFDDGALWADRAAYDALSRMNGAKLNMRLDRRELAALLDATRDALAGAD